MDDFDERFNKAIEAGQRNLRAMKLLTNWCFYAEFVRSPGRGLIEAETGLPIGHMGVQCKFSQNNSMLSWLLEDSAYDFYKHNCKDCKERVPVGFPNIMDFIIPREKAAEDRKLVRDTEEKKRKQKQFNRQQERSILRLELALEETFVLDLIDELDQENIAKDDPRLEQLANLAPEIFTRKVVKHLLPAILNENLPYSIPAAKALLRTLLNPEEKLLVAVYLVNNSVESPIAIDIVLSEAENLAQEDFKKILHRFVSMALESPPSMSFGKDKPRILNATPIKSIFEKNQEIVCREVEILINGPNSAKMQAGVEIILATESDELLSMHIRSIVGKLMRRRTLLPKERRDSSVIYYFREAATKCLDRFPEETDKIIQSYLMDNDESGEKEANKTYRTVLRHNYEKNAHIGMAQRIAFRRLLWAAVRSPEDGMNEATQFFNHTLEEFAQLAIENFDDLIGAAATLSEKYEQINAESSLELPDDLYANIDRRNKRTAIDRLQGALIKWAAIGAKFKGIQGLEDFLNLYRQLPKNQDQMRRNMISHISKLLSGVESLNTVLPDWYSALMDESTLVRAGAAQAWEDVPYELIQNFPNLFFEAFSILLSDPYIIVHKSAVRSLERRSFAEDKRRLIKHSLWNLIYHYSQKSKQEEFVVDCIDVYASLCLLSEEKKGKWGKLLSSILLSLEGSALYHAVDRLHYSFRDVPDFVKVALKAIQDDYTRHISIDDCISTILKAPHNELRSCAKDIKKAFKALKPYPQEYFIEALVYITALNKAGEYTDISECLSELVKSIPIEDRNKQRRLEVALIMAASEIEANIQSRETFVELVQRWKSLSSDLEKENEERTKPRDFPSSLFFED